MEALRDLFLMSHFLRLRSILRLTVPQGISHGSVLHVTVFRLLRPSLFGLVG